MSTSDNLGKIGTGFIVAAGVAALLPFLIALSTIVGALVGLVVGWMFEETFALWLRVLRLEAEPYQVGAALGFVSAFFRSNRTEKKSED